MKYIHAKVFPGYQSERIIERETGKYVVYLREAAKDNAANKRLITILATYLQIPVNKIRIIRGHKNQNKTLELFE